MNASELIFGIKDVVAIIIGLGSIVSFVYVIKSSSEKAKKTKRVKIRQFY